MCAEWAPKVSYYVSTYMGRRFQKYIFPSHCPLEKEMAIHSCILAWRIPWTEDPGGLQSMGLNRVGYN